jgi:hypothetical protein
MKKIICIAALFLSGFLFQTATAQIRVSIKANIGLQPVWGPTGYDHVDYYYMPDIDAFYYVPTQQYIYQQSGRWIYASSLPYRFHNYDVYRGYKVVVNDPRPYRHVETYRQKYGSYKGRRDQEIIRNSQDARYFEVKDHPQHDKWEKDHHGNGRKENNQHQ